MVRWYRDTSINYDMYDSVLMIHSIQFTNKVPSFKIYENNFELQ